MFIQTPKKLDCQKEIPLHTHYSVGQNVGKLGSSHMLVQVRNGAIAVENNAAIPQKVKHRVIDHMTLQFHS